MSAKRKTAYLFLAALAPFMLIAVDIGWRYASGQLAENDNPPFMHKLLFPWLSYAVMIAIPACLFYISKGAHLGLRITLAIVSAPLSAIWVMYIMLLYFCSHGVCI